MYRQDLTLQQAVSSKIPEKCIFQIVVAEMWRISLLKRVVCFDVSQLACPISEASRAWMFSLVKM